MLFIWQTVLNRLYFGEACNIFLNSLSCTVDHLPLVCISDAVCCSSSSTGALLHMPVRHMQERGGPFCSRYWSTVSLEF